MSTDLIVFQQIFYIDIANKEIRDQGRDEVKLQYI